MSKTEGIFDAAVQEYYRLRTVLDEGVHGNEGGDVVHSLEEVANAGSNLTAWTVQLHEAGALDFLLRNRDWIASQTADGEDDGYDSVSTSEDCDCTLQDAFDGCDCEKCEHLLVIARETKDMTEEEAAVFEYSYLSFIENGSYPAEAAEIAHRNAKAAKKGVN
jgi:hypothetical protein